MRPIVSASLRAPEIAGECEGFGVQTAGFAQIIGEREGFGEVRPGFRPDHRRV